MPGSEPVADAEPLPATDCSGCWIPPTPGTFGLFQDRSHDRYKPWLRTDTAFQLHRSRLVFDSSRQTAESPGPTFAAAASNAAPYRVRSALPRIARWPDNPERAREKRWHHQALHETISRA